SPCRCSRTASSGPTTSPSPEATRPRGRLSSKKRSSATSPRLHSCSVRAQATSWACPAAPIRRYRTSLPHRPVVLAHELRHGRRARCAHPGAPDDGGDRLEEDRRVERQAAAVDVLHVERELLGPRQRVAALHLRQARDPRPHLVPPRLLRRVARQV